MATVLVVDDHATNREVARATLDYGGHLVIEAGEGRQALAMARASHPDLIVTDVLMPGMDGYQFVHDLRSDPDTAGIPVLFYTANYREDEAQPLAAIFGVSKIVSKSADPLELLDAVAEALVEAQPVPIRAADTAFDVQHVNTVNAKLLEKVQALDESEARFRTMAEVSPMGIVIGDQRGTATYVNPRLSQITRLPAADLLGEGWLCCLNPEHWRALSTARWPALSPGAEGLRYHGHITLPDGHQRWLTVLIRSIEDSQHTVTGFVAMIDDVTAEVTTRLRRRAEEQQRQAEARHRVTARFESLARLAGGVAHDFNNLLNVIMSSDELARETVEEANGSTLTATQAEALLGNLDQIYRAGQRGARLTHQLLTFGSREVATPTVVDVNTIIDDLQKTIAADLGPRIAVTTERDPRPCRVYADAGQLRQALRNLVSNAGDAMPDGGRLHIRAATTRIENTESFTGLGAGEYVHLSVADTGRGMSADIAEHAMEPFFTTKPSGQGAGLGLATAYGVIAQADGELLIDSAPGRGTTMHIYLPATDLPTVTARHIDAPPATTGRTILLAEDDDDVRDVVTRLLTRAGYRVLAAANGGEALDLVERHDEVIHALLTDVMMPTMNGRELAQALHRVRPGIPVLYMSGYAAPIMTEKGLLDPDVTLLGKPFTKAELLNAVHATLAGQPSARAGTT